MKPPSDAEDPARFAAAIRRIDEENARDPTRVWVAGTLEPFELAYSRWVTDWVQRLHPHASEALLLAARSQHLCRWIVPRASYPNGRAGYLKWRADLKLMHAEKSGAILAEAGYSPELVARVRALNLKQNLGHDPEAQVLEDALCLVTLEHQLPDLMGKTEPEKMISILQKTWRKMSPAAREAALKLAYSDAGRALIERALAS